MKPARWKKMAYYYANFTVKRLKKVNGSDDDIIDEYLKELRNFYSLQVSSREVSIFCHAVENKFLYRLGSKTINSWCYRLKNDFVAKAKQRESAINQINEQSLWKQNDRIGREIQGMFNRPGIGAYDEARGGVRSIVLIAKK